jgi:hypothetical protein
LASPPGPPGQVAACSMCCGTRPPGQVKCVALGLGGGAGGSEGEGSSALPLFLYSKTASLEVGCRLGISPWLLAPWPRTGDRETENGERRWRAETESGERRRRRWGWVQGGVGGGGGCFRPRSCLLVASIWHISQKESLALRKYQRGPPTWYPRALMDGFSYFFRWGWSRGAL